MITLLSYLFIYLSSYLLIFLYRSSLSGDESSEVDSLISEESYSSERNSRLGDGENIPHKPSRRKKRKVLSGQFYAPFKSKKIVVKEKLFFERCLQRDLKPYSSEPFCLPVILFLKHLISDWLMFLSEKFFMQAELRNGNIRPLQF